ncbi:MAG: hypothetical protein GY799_25450 [Desulfobulbaceae bacterium]|nr:hypothetical protein [Desulfobulbaceae bacterium]
MVPDRIMFRAGFQPVFRPVLHRLREMYARATVGFHTGSYDQDTFESVVQLVGKGTPSTDHTAPIYAFDHEGKAVSFETDEPVWKGARVELDPDQLFATFTTSATSPDPLVNLRMTFSDGSTWGMDFGAFIERSYASGASQTQAGIPQDTEIKFFGGNNAALTHFYCHGNNLTGSIPSLDICPNLIQIWCQSNNLTGSIPSLSGNVSVTYVYFHANNLTGSIPPLNANTALVRYYCDNNNLSGTIPSLNNNTALALFHVHNNNLTGFEGGWPNKAFSFVASNNALTEAAVNQILIDADTYGIATGTTITINGGTNAAPTGAGATAKASLISGGATVTTN